MPNLNLRRFAQPETLHRIHPKHLIEWLRPAQSYLASRGVALPDLAAGATVNIEALATIFVDPQPGMPACLVDSLYLIHETGDPRGMDAILEAAEERSLDLLVGDAPDPVDVAVRAWCRAPDLLEQVHNRHQLTRPRSYLHFQAAANPVPVFNLPPAERLTALQARLDNWFARRKRGRGCRVFAYPDERECRFLVRHGLPCKREGIMDDGDGTSIFYRPQKHDVLVYNIASGEIRINCCGRREMEEYRQAFGAFLFNDEEFFPGTAKYTLAPLITGRDCLACLDISGMERVTLKEVEFLYRGDPWQRVTREADDIFTLVESGLLKWPAADRITRASFEVKFTDSRKTRRVSILPSNKALYTRDDDSGMIEQWLTARRFIADLAPDEDAAVKPATTTTTTNA